MQEAVVEGEEVVAEETEAQAGQQDERERTQGLGGAEEKGGQFTQGDCGENTVPSFPHIYYLQGMKRDTSLRRHSCPSLSANWGILLKQHPCFYQIVLDHCFTFAGKQRIHKSQYQLVIFIQPLTCQPFIHALPVSPFC